MNVSSDNHMIIFTSNSWVGRECNSKQKVGNFKHCHRHHPWHIFLWPQYSSGRLNNIDSCAPLQPNNNIFQVQTLKALNTAAFCHIEMYQHFRGTCCLHHFWSYSVTSWLLPDCTVLHFRRQQCSSSSAVTISNLVHENTDQRVWQNWSSSHLEEDWYGTYYHTPIVSDIFHIYNNLCVACAQTKVSNIHFGANFTLCQQRTTQIFNHRFYQDFCVHASCCTWIASKALFCRHMYIELPVLY